ncbi:conserved hypothetical protein [Aeropyrum pernix K1]|uniref:Radical SAM core domain-containing protein n=2 Tax=Aeropyrum pernix TaxID=56636 RepID=Q9Y8Q6_AERPE|nr:conserved hypothetical protein [Aeropyrum pernix K1]
MYGCSGLAGGTQGGGAAGVPNDVKLRWYRIRPPLVKRSGITGWAINFAVGCTHACPFCYVDAINRRYPRRGLEDLITSTGWGGYLAVPTNILEAIKETPWWRWRGREVFMSSAHDPYLPALARWAREILRRALPAGLRIILHTRSILYKRDLRMFEQYRDRIRIHASVATMSRLHRIIEPRAPPPRVRVRVLAEASSRGLSTGASISPILPPNKYNPDVYNDLLAVAEALAEAGVEVVYGESLHKRGDNVMRLSSLLGTDLNLRGWDRHAEKLFYRAIGEYGLRGVWIPEW